MSDQRWVDVSHEALIRGWPRLRRWIEENRSGLRVHRRLTEAALEWEKASREHGSLYRGARLAQATEWRQANEAALNDLERAFLDASEALERYEIEARERLRRRIIAGLSITLVIFITLTVLAFLQWRQAERRGQIALARQLAAQADLLRDQPEMRSRRLALATEAMQRLNAVDAPSLEVDATLRREIALSPRFVARFPIEVKGTVDDVELSPDGRFVIGGNYFEGAASVWEIATGKELVRIESGVRELTLTRFGQEPIRIQLVNECCDDKIAGLSTEGKILVTALGDGSRDITQVWEVASGRELLRLNLQGNNRYALSDDGRYLAASTSTYDNVTNKWSDATIRVWDIKTRREIPGGMPDIFNRRPSSIPAPAGRIAVRAAATTPAGQQRIATVSVDGDAVDVWEVRPEGGSAFAIDPGGTVLAAGLTPQGRLTTIAHNGASLTARTWDIGTGQEKPDLATDIAGTGATFAPDGISFAVRSESGLEVRKVGDLQPVAKLAYAGSTAIAWSPDGQYLAASTEKEARVWNLGSRQSIGQLALPGPPTDLALSKGGEILAAVIRSGEMTRSGEVHTMKLWNVASSEELSSFETDQGRIRSDTHCALDTRYLATDDMQLFEMKSGAVRQIGLGGNVSYCVLSVDGRYLAISSGEETIVWELKNRKKAFQIPTEDRPVAFDQESRYLVTISSDTVRVWSLRQDDLIAEACRRLPRNLSEQEWPEYLGDEAYHKTCPELP